MAKTGSYQDIGYSRTRIFYNKVIIFHVLATPPDLFTLNVPLLGADTDLYRDPHLLTAAVENSI